MIDQVLQALDSLKERLAVGCTAPQALELLSNVGHLLKTAGVPDVAKGVELLADAALDAGPAKAKQTIATGLAKLRGELERANHLGDDPASSLAPVDKNARTSGAHAKPATSQAIAQDPQLIGDFINESREHIADIETQVLQLESDPHSLDSLHSAFRSFHTIKGLAGFLELGDIREVSHEVETLLDRARNRQLEVTPSVIDVVLEGGDYLKRAVDWVETGLRGDPGEPPAFDVLIKRVRLASKGDPIPHSMDKVSRVADGPSSAVPASAAASPEKVTESANTFSLRVDAGKLDSMIDIVGELMIAQSLVMHSPELQQVQGAALLRNLQQLQRITSELQRVSMGLRMAPVGQLFGRMTRIVRDLSRKNGKSVRLELTGEETELDKTIVEQLADPLMHMVRNSLDHGLEPLDERTMAGKPSEGRLKLSAYQQAGHIVIEVSDDGRGLNAAKILDKARERGLVSPNYTPADAEIYHLIFEPGFSTAEKVTEVSGRGVGMDVVRRQIQSLRGRIDIQSIPGEGTTFFLRLPLTLAIVEGLIVTVGSEHYVIPVSAVQEMLRPTPEMLVTLEERAEMALVRGNVLPIIRLSRRFDIQNAKQDPCDGLLIVTTAEGRRCCVLVDSLVGKQEVVIKNLGEMFRGIPGVSGGAILGDGRIGLILDVNSLLREPAVAS
jgi:two-component system, chemotaxis family, sensor kinase CheA